MNIKTNLMKYAIDYLSKYSSSKKNLERILKKKIQKTTNDKKQRYELYNQINNILKKLEDNKLINDSEYCLNKIRIFVSNGKSKNYIINSLRQKGLSNDVIENSIMNFEEDNNNWEIESAYTFANKKNLFDNKFNIEKKIRKMAQAGFSYQLCKEIFKIN